ncbi:hypothetical protein LPTSP4_21130 [Leptospira ryugenii]|uniref:Lipoprotein n=1 Tax=Leptospira ryugenii TaxID=1917863 RepID=A0A2P2E120_9LEPT|nr:putative lipoprotein [Leptospira ryugenii]GBF50587.1 hypothetical protein LPTSP4_21130 [Leptospira ryugenii]
MKLFRFLRLSLPFLLTGFVMVCASLDTASGSLSRLGFSISDSTSALLKSLSTSVSSVSDSISKATEEEKAAMYQKDIEAAIVLLHEEPKSASELERELQNIAMKHGISNWQGQSVTYVGIGKGLRLAGAKESEFLALKDTLALQNQSIAKHLEEGYKSN